MHTKNRAVIRQKYYRIADMTICVESDIPFQETTFHPKFKLFETDSPGHDTVFIHHHFEIPDTYWEDSGEEIYRTPPWQIFRQDTNWIYKSVAPQNNGHSLYQVSVINQNHTRADIYHATEEYFREGNNHSLTLFPTDQIFLARTLADRKGCYFHSSGAIIGKKGFLFAGHSGTGKSTVMTNLDNTAEILCDDRNIVKATAKGFRLYGTWSHGDIETVSGNSAPLEAVMFLEQANEDRLVILEDKKKIMRRLLALLIKPLITADWWEKMLTLVECLSDETPFYNLHLTKTANIMDLIRQEQLINEG